jgi:hypothetical protein
MQIDETHAVENLMSLEEEIVLYVLVRGRNVSLEIEWNHLVKLLEDLF